MKVLIVLLSLRALALASLEPAGYRPPGGASSSTQYLPPHLDKGPSSLSPPSPPSSPRYLTPPPPASPSPYYYLPPQVQLRPQKPPAPPTPSPPSNTYLPPLSSPAPTTEYLPPSSSISSSSIPPAAPAVPGNYLPPAVARKPVSTTAVPPVSQPALPAVTRDQYPQVPGVEQPPSNYLPPVSPDRPRYGYDAEAATALGHEKLTTQQPAKYDFEYRVSDEFGNDYSHKESRDGSQTQGFYSVLLPDGRKQIVHYEADEAGFRPRISYEEVATVLGPQTPDVAGYDSNANSLGTQGPY